MTYRNINQARLTTRCTKSFPSEQTFGYGQKDLKLHSRTKPELPIVLNGGVHGFISSFKKNAGIVL